MVLKTGTVKEPVCAPILDSTQLYIDFEGFCQTKLVLDSQLNRSV